MSAITRFEKLFELPISPPIKLVRPPMEKSIALMWGQEFHSLQHRPNTRDPHADCRVSFGTICQIRSAAAHRLTWQHVATIPDYAFLDPR